MRKFDIAAKAIIVAANMLVAACVSAQPCDYDAYKAAQARHQADVHSYQAHRDQHAADVAADNGDYASADAYAHAAHTRQEQARRDGYAARHDADAARWDCPPPPRGW